MAPEVMDPRSAANLNLECPTTALSDVYSFGMTMLEVCLLKFRRGYRHPYSLIYRYTREMFRSLLAGSMEELFWT